MFERELDRYLQYAMSRIFIITMSSYKLIKINKIRKRHTIIRDIFLELKRTTQLHKYIRRSNKMRIFNPFIRENKQLQVRNTSDETERWFALLTKKKCDKKKRLYFTFNRISLFPARKRTRVSAF